MSGGEAEKDASPGPMRHGVKPEELIVGCKCFAEKDGEKRRAEILAIHTRKGKLVFYVHYQDFNKRLDEWISVDRIDLAQPVEWPKPAAPKKPPAGRGAAKDTKKKKLKGESIPGSEVSTPSGGNGNGNGNAEGSQDVMDLDNLDVQGLKKQAGDEFSREDEIKKLRTSGSMTQNNSEVARVRNLSKIIVGSHIIEPWYFSPYPIELTEEDVLYICDFSMSYFGSKKQFERFRKKCTLRHPPGTEIYRDDYVSFWEIDGRKQRSWCRNLCLFSKLFLDHKTLYYDVDPFLFYCMTRRDELGHHLVGYFSKEKESADGYNVACILTLPQYQRHGYGRLLIQFSYELSKKEGKVGSPEKPLSDLGLMSYRAYWSDTLTLLLCDLVEERKDITIDEISGLTSMTTTDILHTLQTLNVLRYYKGSHVVCITNALKEKRDKLVKKNRRVLDPAKIKWTPPVFTASQLRFGW